MTGRAKTMREHVLILGILFLLGCSHSKTLNLRSPSGDLQEQNSESVFSCKVSYRQGSFKDYKMLPQKQSAYIKYVNSGDNSCVARIWVEVPGLYGKFKLEEIEPYDKRTPSKLRIENCFNADSSLMQNMLSHKHFPANKGVTAVTLFDHSTLLERAILKFNLIQQPENITISGRSYQLYNCTRTSFHPVLR